MGTSMDSRRYSMRRGVPGLSVSLGGVQRMERDCQSTVLGVGMYVELAYGQAPGYWEIRELLAEGDLLVTPVPGTSDPEVASTPRRVPKSSATRVVSLDEVSLRRGLLDDMRRRCSA